MRYLNERSLTDIGIDWNETIDVVETAVRCMQKKDFAQPIKPYLRYKQLINRIIAMPAYVGGDVSTAGIKWIASFPNNYKMGLPRAHCVVITNDADTGQPAGIINTSLISGIRTASVSGVFIRDYHQAKKQKNIVVGIIGFGPIGQLHLKMCLALLQDDLAVVNIYDTRNVDETLFNDPRVRVVSSWQEAFDNADIFMTCTVSSGSYIDREPKPGSLHLNVSLRDYTTNTYQWFRGGIIVDNWEEVCREKTDIENMSIHNGLTKEQTYSIDEVVESNLIQSMVESNTTIMVNPMGMAIFDIAVSKYYLDKAVDLNIGLALD